MDTRQRLENALAGRYRVERELGEGGMALVYLAEDLKHHRPVAIKVLRPELSEAFASERFHREIETVAGLNHPGILGLHDSGEADGLRFFVMPFVEGESLRVRLDREGPLPLDEAIRITREVGDALQYAHDQGLVHRDVKPENVLFQAGHALMADFGIAQVASEAKERLTRTGVAVGTVAYMSPEQLTDGGVVDRRSDVYGLGCVFLEMLTGETPFEATHPQVSLAKKYSGTLPDLASARSDVPPTVQAVLEGALAVDPATRFPTAEAFTSALQAATTRAAVEADARRRRRARILRSVAIVAGLALVGVAGWWISSLTGGPAMGRVAILPLVNQQNDPDQEYFVQGVHQELTTELARAGMTGGLLVTNWTSMARFSGSLLPVREIAREVEADGIVQGFASLRGDQVSVDLQLVDGRTEDILWAGTFQATMGSLSSLYHQAVRALTDYLDVPLDPETRARLAQVQEMDAQIQRALLQAEYHYRTLTEGGLATAMSYYEAILDRDSLQVDAWAGIASVWVGRAQMGIIPGIEGNQRASEAMARAEAIDPEHPAVQGTRASRLVWSQWRFQEGADAMAAAIAEDPTNTQGHAGYAHVLLFLNRDDEALHWSREVAQRDPFSTIAQSFLAMTLNNLRRYEEAEAVLLPVLERDPQAPLVLTTLRTTYHLMGRHEEAIGMWRSYYSGDPEAVEALDRGYEDGGYSAALRGVADLLLSRADTMYVRPWLISTTLLRAGMAQEAVPYLQAAFEEHDNNMPYISVDPIFDPIRTDPRFREILRRMGLPE